MGRLGKIFLAICLLASASAQAQYSTPGLVWGSGVESGDPSQCEALGGYNCYWVDCEATTDGSGTYASPFWGFETVFGYYAGGNYQLGLARGGDIVYVKDTCGVTGSVDNATGPYKQIRLARGVQYGTKENPLVIKSWRNTAAAIFDGEYATTLAAQNDSHNAPVDLMRFNNTNANGGYVRVQNVKLRNYYSYGLHSYGEITGLHAYNVDVQNGRADNTAGTGGSISIQVSVAGIVSDHIIERSYFKSNNLPCLVDRSGCGGPITAPTLNNEGSICVLSEPGAEEGSQVIVRDNIFDDEIRAVRGKHNGNVNIAVYGNLIKNGYQGFYLRGENNDIHHNVISNLVDGVFALANEDLHTAVNLTAYNNSIYNVGGLVRDATGWTSSGAITLYNNLYKSNLTARAMELAVSTPQTFNPAQWTSDHNYFDISGTTNTTFSCFGPTSSGTSCTNRSFSSTMTFLSDASSSATSFTYSNPAGDDFGISLSDSAATAGRSGTFLGALDPTNYITSNRGISLIRAGRRL